MEQVTRLYSIGSPGSSAKIYFLLAERLTMREKKRAWDKGTESHTV
jgi:hypothetical protein